VEYLQSHEIDSYQLYRWEDDGDGPSQVKNALHTIDSSQYTSIILAGFSAGCNTILRAIKEEDVVCDKIILQSPWIPMIENELEDLIDVSLKKEIEILMVCGQNDEVSLSQCVEFDKSAKEAGLKCRTILVDGLGHEYPNDFRDIVLDFL